MNKTELLALAERVERADGPDRELDAEIALAAGWEKSTDEEWVEYWHLPDKGQIPHIIWQPYRARDIGAFRTALPYFTASIDAAITLVPGGKEWTLDCLDPSRDPRFGHCQARIMLLDRADDPEELGPQAIANGNTPALALTAAALRAIAGCADD